MAAPPGTPDILTLSVFAYQIYDTYKGAPKRFKALCDDINGLSMVLRRLANRLALQEQTEPEKVDTDSDPIALKMLAEEYADLEKLVQQTGALLEELQKRQGSIHAPRGLNRFKWSQSEVDSLRSRIVSLCGIISAFNSSIVLRDISPASRNPDQQLVLEKLDTLLLGIQEGNRPSSLLSTAETHINTPPPRGEKGDKVWCEMLKEMQTYGISQEEASQNRAMILNWAEKAAAAGIVGEQLPDVKSMIETSKNQTEEYEVLSAVYGPMIVTDAVRQIFHSHLQHKISKIGFTVTNETFGNDPWPGNVKAFSMVWRKAIHLDYGTVYTVPQRIFAEERQTVSIDLNTPNQYHDSVDGKPGSIYIISASWHNENVTEKVAKFVSANRRPSIVGSVYEFQSDPRFGTVKTLSVTWAYSNAPAALSYCEVKTVRENETLEIPPFLDIICANWGGLDITTVLRAKIGPHQTLQLDTNNMPAIASPDPWLGERKTIAILYQYGSDPLQLLVCHEGQGLVTIRPDGPTNRRHIFLSKNEPLPNTTILAVIWGLQPVAEEPVLEAISKNSKFPCTNEFFNRDGWGGQRKTCQVFLQNNSTGETTCVVRREGTTLALPGGALP